MCKYRLDKLFRAYINVWNFACGYMHDLQRKNIFWTSQSLEQGDRHFVFTCTVFDFKVTEELLTFIKKQINDLSLSFSE